MTNLRWSVELPSAASGRQQIRPGTLRDHELTYGAGGAKRFHMQPRLRSSVTRGLDERIVDTFLARRAERGADLEIVRSLLLELFPSLTSRLAIVRDGERNVLVMRHA